MTTNIFDEQLAEQGCYADNAEAFYQSIKRRLNAEWPNSVMTVRQQVRLAITLKLMEDDTQMSFDPVIIAHSVTLMERIVLHGEDVDPNPPTLSE